jgi:hypothetical protein
MRKGDALISLLEEPARRLVAQAVDQQVRDSDPVADAMEVIGKCPRSLEGAGLSEMMLPMGKVSYPRNQYFKPLTLRK